jgi:hypothetical protein
MQKSVKLLLSLGIFATGLAVAAPAQAQDPTSPPPPQEERVVTRSSSGGSGAGLGVGGVVWLSGFSGAQVVYDQAMWHIEGVLAFGSFDNGAADNTTAFNFGAAGWYHLHRGSSSDFSLGGGIGVISTSNPDSSTFVFEPGALARIFLTPNVALFARTGIAAVFGDGDPVTGAGGERVVLFGQTTSSFGFTYFFR